MRIALALIACLAGAGCVLSQSTDGTPLDDAQVEALEIGRSTRADVVRLFGAPDDIIYSNLAHDALVERAFRYERTRRKTTFFSVILFSTSRSDRNGDHLVVFFDDEGIVQDVAARLDMDRPRYGGPWGDDR
jgi:outer membrane protein assembly factor BamE (lipoprotein component of BamABCDE complex)